MPFSQAVLHDLFTVRDFIRYGVSRFNEADLYYGHGTDNALDEATQLVLHTLNMPHDLPGHFMEARLTETEKREVLAILQRRVSERLPAAYLTHEAWFAGMPFFVDERVLVPRSPLAELIEQQFEPWIAPDRVHAILDLCTGSGCIAIACAHYFPDASVDAADISEDALEVARINVAEHGLEERVQLLHSDLFANLQDRRYDIIVTNPPYVDVEEIASMPEEYRREPMLGLASGADGLDATRVILRQAASHLNEAGILICEVGASDQALQQAFPQVPFMWLEFERGGSGVFLLTREQLLEYADSFAESVETST